MIMAGRLVAEGRPGDLRQQYAAGGSLDEVFVRLVRQA
jgi:hypothetical protein